MKRTHPERPPYLSMCLIVRNAYETMEVTLRSIRDRAPDAEIVVIDTCSNDSGLEIEITTDRRCLERDELAQALRKVLPNVRSEPTLRGLRRTPVLDGVVTSPWLALLGGYQSLPEHAIGLCGLIADMLTKELFGTENLDRVRVGLKAVYPVSASHTIAQTYADVWEEYKGPAGTWNREMPWFDDAAAARNRSFELASGVWKGWIDADDELPNLELMLKLLRANGIADPKRDTTGRPEGERKTAPSLTEILQWFEMNKPDNTVIWCPYLYRFTDEKTGQAMIWQNRERFVRRSEEWIWRNKAHEVLVPKLANPIPLSFVEVLFVHRKRFSLEDERFALMRHYDVLSKKLDAEGKVTTQEALYLSNYAGFICPQRKNEFLGLAYSSANNPLEMMRAMVASANESTANGFYMEAFAQYAGAAALRGDIPDPHFAGARAYEQAEQWLPAAEWYSRGIACRVAAVDSEVAPFFQTVEARLRAAQCLYNAGRDLLRAEDAPRAQQCFESAAAFATQAGNSPACVGDYSEAARCIAGLCSNLAQAQQIADMICKLHDFLVRNDETEKAAQLLSVAPHMLRDHPAMVKLEAFTEKLHTHLTDPKSYQAFYEDDAVTGAIPTEQAGVLAPPAQQLPRVRFLLEQLRKRYQGQSIRVIEFGCFDGNIGIPILRELGNAQYTGVEAQQPALARFRERLGSPEWDVPNPERAELIHSLESGSSDGKGAFDAAVFFEVIEHVPDPVSVTRRLLEKLKPGGVLFMSTPWGSFDKGHPDMSHRDPRGHVRALDVQGFVDMVRQAGGRVLELGGTPGMAGWSATMHAMVERLESHRPQASKPALAFYVPGALWDWNASHLIKTGMGASEETIVYMGRELARDRLVSVYGPVPEQSGTLMEEVNAGVAYWPRERFRKASVEGVGTVVVSRSPSMGVKLDELAGRELDKILWLQDAYYPDLSALTAADYRSVVVLTEWHKQIMHENHGVPLDKLKVIGNFLLPEQFSGLDFSRRDPHRFIYASSPDRGLIPLLRMWPSIRDRWPDATLQVFYGWAGAMKLGSGYGNPGWIERYRRIRTEYMQLRHQPGIVDVGRVSHEEIARELSLASAYLYPGDDRPGGDGVFGETFCSNAVKARAAGCVMVCSPFAGLLETADSPFTQYVPMMPFAEPLLMPNGIRLTPYEAAFLKGIEAAVEVSESDRKIMAQAAIEKYQIGNMTRQWRMLLEG